MMLKYLLLAVVLIWLFYSPALRSLRGRTPTRAAPASPPSPPKAENMVQCAQCGVHLPQGEALIDEQGRRYCSAAHRSAGPAPR
jgi:uncharacterized protein